MEAMSALDERQQYRVAISEVRSRVKEQSFSFNKIEMLKELTLTLLKEVESLNEIKELQVHEDGCLLNLHDEVRRLEVKMIRRALALTGGHQARAAQLLGVKATTFHAKLKRYRIDPDLPDNNIDAGSSFDGTDGDDSCQQKTCAPVVVPDNGVGAQG